MCLAGDIPDDPQRCRCCILGFACNRNRCCIDLSCNRQGSQLFLENRSMHPPSFPPKPSLSNRLTCTLHRLLRCFLTPTTSSTSKSHSSLISPSRGFERKVQSPSGLTRLGDSDTAASYSTLTAAEINHTLTFAQGQYEIFSTRGSLPPSPSPTCLRVILP